MHIYYTTYDTRRGRDLIKLQMGKCDIITPSREVEGPENGDPMHPFWYARVVGIYHAMVALDAGLPTRMEFLLVRWFATVEEAPGGWNYRCMDQVGFQEPVSRQLGFLDPANVIRACHLIPNWHYGVHPMPLHSVFTLQNELEGCDYQFYFVNRYGPQNLQM